MAFIQEWFADSKKATSSSSFLHHLRIPLKDIKKAISNFAEDNLIGKGGFGNVYKGELLLRQGGSATVAIKRVTGRSNQRASDEFLKEISVLSTYKHENIVSLFGYCDEKGEMILVQEFLANGSLDKHLSSADLTWLNRLQICVGTARGLDYLHNPPETHQQSVIHSDIKSANILLDQNWQPKITDFGICEFLPENEESTSHETGVVGTMGYLDPLYYSTGVLTKESDIYSFGVVLFQVLCGRRAIFRSDDDVLMALVTFAIDHYEIGTLTEIIDPVLKKQMNPVSLNVFSALAYQCLKEDRLERPTIRQIVEKLEETLGLQQEFDKALALQKVADDLKGRQEDEDDFYKVKNMEHMKIPLEDIKRATHEFHDNFTIGFGGFGKVYKAELFHFDVKKYVRENKFQKVSEVELLSHPRRQSTVAIKRLNRRYGQGTPEFLQEISVLLCFRHQNLVTLVGFCDEDHERILVYEYASNGSLDDYIHGAKSTKSLNWAVRLQICLGAAHGIDFLHNGVGEHHRIIHRDIKSSNILLDRNWTGMISDFGLSRIGPANLQATFVMTQVAGTLEYIDPQYHKTGMLTKESDIYSFGVVLFEMLSGRLARFHISKDNPEFVPNMARRCFEDNKVHEIIDPKLKKEFNETLPDSVIIFANIAYNCLRGKREDRPTMAHVVEELEKAFKSQVKGVEALRTSLDTIRFATNDFETVMEQGEFGKVYKGELSHSKGDSVVIVKRLDTKIGPYGEEFYKKIVVLHSYNHKNVISLLAFCEEESERIVVFERMVNGSLKDHLKNSSLTWKHRLQVCINVAHGLACIHNHDEMQYSIHGDVKSNNILLNHDWQAAVSHFILSKATGTLGYHDPLFATTGNLTQKSDVYSFGVVLFEILSGRMAIEVIKSSRGDRKDGRAVFLAQLAKECFESKKLEEIIFHGIRTQIQDESLVTFSKIAYQCLLDQREGRPTMAKVVEELEKAFKCQDEWEWEQKLPIDYEEIVSKSKYPVSTIITKKDLYSLLSSGILLRNEKWFSISMDDVKSEMVSATTFSYKNASHVKWKSIRNSRFSKVAKISDISDLNIQIQIRPQYLTMDKMYGAYLVFKFCDRRNVSCQPLYVNLKYKKGGKTLNAYFAESRGGNKWLMVELFRFFINKETTGFEVILQSFSSYYCGSGGGIFVEGIDFTPISVDHEVNKEIKDEKNMEIDSKSDLDVYLVEQLANDYHDVIMRSEISVQNASKQELYTLLSEGILIDKGQKVFSVSMADRKKCHMLPAKAIICSSPNVKCCIRKPPPQSRCRFAEFVEIRSHYEFRIKCNIETQMLSPNTNYACFLVFQISERCQGLECPVKARDLLPNKNKDKESNIICFRTPNHVNLKHIKWVSEQREDGWREVVVWKMIISDNIGHDGEHVAMDLKLTSFEGSMRGLIVSGIEFRPI